MPKKNKDDKTNKKQGKSLLKKGKQIFKKMEKSNPYFFVADEKSSALYSSDLEPIQTETSSQAIKKSQTTEVVTGPTIDTTRPIVSPLDPIALPVTDKETAKKAKQAKQDARLAIITEQAAKKTSKSSDGPPKEDQSKKVRPTEPKIESSEFLFDVTPREVQPIAMPSIVTVTRVKNPKTKPPQNLKEYLQKPYIPPKVKALADTGVKNYQEEKIKAKAWAEKTTTDAIKHKKEHWAIPDSGAGRSEDWIHKTYNQSENEILDELATEPPPQDHSIAEIKSFHGGEKKKSKTLPTFTIVTGVGANDLHRAALGNNCIVQAASQFDYHESTSSIRTTPVSKYLLDGTHGPQVVIEAASGALHRKAVGKDLGHAFSKLMDLKVGEPPQNLFEKYPRLFMNGYLNLEVGGAEIITDEADKKALLKHLQKNIDLLRILPQWVQCDSNGASQLQVFTAAPYLGKVPAKGSVNEKICELLVVEQYKALAQLAVIRSRETGETVPLHLTQLGVGSFHNPPSVMKKALEEVAKITKGENVAVYVHAYRIESKENLDKQMKAGKGKLFNIKTISAETFKNQPHPSAEFQQPAKIEDKNESQPAWIQAKTRSQVILTPPRFSEMTQHRAPVASVEKPNVDEMIRNATKVRDEALKRAAEARKKAEEAKNTAMGHRQKIDDDKKISDKLTGIERSADAVLKARPNREKARLKRHHESLRKLTTTASVESLSQSKEENKLQEMEKLFKQFKDSTTKEQKGEAISQLKKLVSDDKTEKVQIKLTEYKKDEEFNNAFLKSTIIVGRTPQAPTTEPVPAVQHPPILSSATNLVQHSPHLTDYAKGEKGKKVDRFFDTWRNDLLREIRLELSKNEPDETSKEENAKKIFIMLRTELTKDPSTTRLVELVTKVQKDYSINLNENASFKVKMDEAGLIPAENKEKDERKSKYQL